MINNKECAQKMLDILGTLQEASLELHHAIETRDAKLAQSFLDDMLSVINVILREAPILNKEEPSTNLLKSCPSIHASLTNIGELLLNRPEAAMQKIEFEFLPLVQDAFANLYFFGFVHPDISLMNQYYKNEMIPLYANPYLDEALESGNFKYDLSVVVRAFNKLEYTQICISNLLKHIPSDLRYELILVNHGSTDGTREYFESLKPTKLLDIKINGGGAGSVARIIEGEFVLFVSNDVVVTEHAIENLLQCMRADPKIGWAVPTTPNVSNLQSIGASYGSFDEMLEFAEKNNVPDLYRCEQRVRLCNPIDIRRSSVFYSSQGLGLNGYFVSSSEMEFPDDKVSLLLRRNGYKSVLVKNAYCHHYGSITIKDEVQKDNEQEYYLNGRKTFFKAFGVDPWGTGFCFDPSLISALPFSFEGNIKILGINCGLGSNPLKIKESYKEMYHNLDVNAFNLTDQQVYLEDLSGVSDTTYLVKSKYEMKSAVSRFKYHYILWEDAFSSDSFNNSDMLDYFTALLQPDGVLAIRANTLMKLGADKYHIEGKPQENWIFLKN